MKIQKLELEIVSPLNSQHPTKDEIVKTLVKFLTLFENKESEYNAHK